MKHLLLLGLLLAPIPAQAAIDPFYQGLLRDGQLAFDRKEYANAARALRLACFGMLDEPRLLADCLSRLALAQDGAGDATELRETFKRLVEVEDRFKGYSQGELPLELRAALETRLATRLPAATLAGTPAFRSTLAKKNPAPATSPAPPRSGAPASAPVASAPVDSTPPAPVPGAAPATVSPPAVAKTAAPAPATPPAPKPLTDGERKQLDQARKLLGEPRPSKDLRQAFELARSVADAHPDSKEAQHLAAEGAYRISRWKDAALYFSRGGDPGGEEPERLFYMAVSLYESGDAEAASTALKRALPNLKQTPYVESYMRKILGSQ